MSTNLGDAFQNVNADDYDKYRPRYPLQSIGKMFREFDIDQPATFADLGAGSGFLSIPLAGENTVYHVDASAPMNNLAAQKYSKIEGDYYKDKLQIIRSDADTAYIPERSVDVVLMGNAAHWMEPKSKAINRKLDQICKPNAKVVIAYNMHNANNTETNKIISRVEHLFISDAIRQNTGSVGHITDERWQKSVDPFIAQENRKRFRDEYTVNMSESDFIGYVSTFSFAINKLDDDKKKSLANIFNEFATDTQQGKRIELSFCADFVCGDRAQRQEIHTTL